MNKISKKFIIATGILIAGSIISIWVFWQNILLLTVILAGLAVMELLVIGSKKLLLAYFLILLGGVTTEIVAIYLGAWQYTKSSFLGIPLWLLPAWGNAGIISICIYKFLDKIKQ